MCILVSFSLSIFLYLFNTGDFRIPYRCSLKISGPPFQRFDSVDLRLVCDFAFLTLFQVMLQLLVQEQCLEKHCCGTILPRESMHFALLLTTNSHAEAASSPVEGLALGLPLTRVGICPTLGQNKYAFFATNGSALSNFNLPSLF